MVWCLVFDVCMNRERKFWRQDQHAYIVFKPKTGKQTYYQVARFVYEAFHGLLTDEQQVYFVNGNSDDRSLTNLTSMTAKDRKVQLIANLENELGGRRHPSLKDYVGLPDGRVYSLVRERYLEGYVKSSGYVRYGKVEGHKIIYECFNGLVNGKTNHIDHINNVHDDNRLINLQKLTRREHSIKTLTIDHPLAGKKTGVSLSKALIRIRKDKKGNILEEVFFENVQQAIIETMKEFPEIKIMTADSLTPRTNTNETYKGFFWKFQDPVDLPGEVWKAVPLREVDLRVSTAGRVEFKNQRRTFGSSIGQAKYMWILHNKKSYPVHFLVCATFHKHPTTLDDKTITPDHMKTRIQNSAISTSNAPAKYRWTIPSTFLVAAAPDHINHKVDDNRSENLQWATKREQVLNRRCMKVIIAIDKSNDTEVGSYETIDDARTAFKVGRNTIIRSLNGSTKYSKSIPSIRFEWRERKDEHILVEDSQNN